jgi:hypothetical protein
LAVNIQQIPQHTKKRVEAILIHTIGKITPFLLPQIKSTDLKKTDYDSI